MSPHLRALMTDAEAKLPELKGHGERTASFAVAAAHKFGVHPMRLASLRIAAALHYSFTPCCSPDLPALVRATLPDDLRAADFIRGMFASWNMPPIESSILAAACRHDLQKIGVDCYAIEVRQGADELIMEAAKIITPLDYVSLNTV